MNDEKPSRESRSLLALIRELPSLLVALVKAELAAMAKELARKAKYAGIGIGLFVFAACLGFFLLGVLIAAAVLGLAVVFPGWLAALLVAAGLLIIAGIAVVVGIACLKRGLPPVPNETVASIREDYDALKGMGRYGRE